MRFVNEFENVGGVDGTRAVSLKPEGGGQHWLANLSSF
jgi:hypothetical protein